jgi:hypothetical protein
MLLYVKLVSVEIFNDLKSIYSIGIFLAFIIFGNEAIFGVLSLKSHVITAGNLTLNVYIPVSIYLVTYKDPSLATIFEANVA